MSSMSSSGRSTDSPRPIFINRLSGKRPAAVAPAYEVAVRHAYLADAPISAAGIRKTIEKYSPAVDALAQRPAQGKTQGANRNRAANTHSEGRETAGCARDFWPAGSATVSYNVPIAPLASVSVATTFTKFGILSMTAAVSVGWSLLDFPIVFSYASNQKDEEMTASDKRGGLQFDTSAAFLGEISLSPGGGKPAMALTNDLGVYFRVSYTHDVGKQGARGLCSV